jgi:hypothetical protein
VREFLAEVLAGNRRMIGVFKGSGFPIECSTELGVERVLLTIADEERQVLGAARNHEPRAITRRAGDLRRFLLLDGYPCLRVPLRLI